jgi:hypothetical protein
MDFSQVKIHCSSLGCLFTEPQSKADKEAGKLSKTAQAHLIKVYAKEYWGRERRIETKQMAKGKKQEWAAIELIGDFDGRTYTKNASTLEDEYIIGTPDIIDAETSTILDAKSSWDSETFLPKLIEPLDKDYFIQLQGYLRLTDFIRGKVSYTLVNATEQQILDEQRKLFYQMDAATEESPEYLLACADVERQMTFDDIPKHERVIHKQADRDQDIIDQIPDKVIKARKFLQEFHELHTAKTKHPNI